MKIAGNSFINFNIANFYKSINSNNNDYNKNNNNNNS